MACRSRTTPRPQNASKSRWLGCNVISRNQCFATTTNTVSAQQRQRQQQTKKTSYNRKGGKSIYVAATQRILESPVGSLDSRTWHEAEWTIKFWNKQATPESVKYAFALLDRFLQEYYHNIERKDSSGSKNDDFLSEKNNTAFPVILSSANLNFSVNNWRLCAKKLNTTSRRTSSIPNPTEMLQTIDSFRTKHHRDQNLMPLSPNVFTYSMILDALAFGQPDLGENSYPLASAKAIDKNKIKADDNGNVGWDFSITPAPIIAERILERLMEEGKEDILVRPTIVTFNSAMKVWARSRMQEAPDRAEALLMKIKELSKQEEWTDLEPNNSTYAAVINTFAGSGREDAIKKVEVMLQEIKMSPFSDVYPNGDIYLGVLKAFGRSQDPSAGQRASGLLQEVVTRYQILRKQGNGADGNEDEFASIIREIQATYKCFLAVMNIFVNQREPQRAEDVLDDLQSLYEASGHERHLCPDSAAFNTGMCSHSMFASI